MERRTFITVATGIGATLAGCSESTNGNGNDGDPYSEENIENRAEGIESTLTAFYNGWLHGDADKMRDQLHEPRAWPSEEFFDREGDVGFDEELEIETVTIQDWKETEENDLRSAMEDSDLLDEEDVDPILEANTWSCLVNIEVGDHITPETEAQEQRLEQFEGVVEGNVERGLSWQDGKWRVVY